MLGFMIAPIMKNFVTHSDHMERDMQKRGTHIDGLVQDCSNSSVLALTAVLH